MDPTSRNKIQEVGDAFIGFVKSAAKTLQRKFSDLTHTALAAITKIGTLFNERVLKKTGENESTHSHPEPSPRRLSVGSNTQESKRMSQAAGPVLTTTKQTQPRPPTPNRPLPQLPVQVANKNTSSTEAPNRQPSETTESLTSKLNNKSISKEELQASLGRILGGNKLYETKVLAENILAYMDGNMTQAELNSSVSWLNLFTEDSDKINSLIAGLKPPLTQEQCKAQFNKFFDDYKSNRGHPNYNLQGALPDFLKQSNIEEFLNTPQGRGFVQSTPHFVFVPVLQQALLKVYPPTPENLELYPMLVAERQSQDGRVWLNISVVPTLPVANAVNILKEVVRHQTHPVEVRVTYLGSKGIDAGGLQRQFFSEVVQGFVVNQPNLFGRAAGGTMFPHNPTQKDVDMQAYEDFGKFLGMAMTAKCPTGVVLSEQVLDCMCQFTPEEVVSGTFDQFLERLNGLEDYRFLDFMQYSTMETEAVKPHYEAIANKSSSDEVVLNAARELSTLIGDQRLGRFVEADTPNVNLIRNYVNGLQGTVKHYQTILVSDESDEVDLKKIKAAAEFLAIVLCDDEFDQLLNQNPLPVSEIRKLLRQLWVENNSHFMKAAFFMAKGMNERLPASVGGWPNIKMMGAQKLSDNLQGTLNVADIKRYLKYPSEIPEDANAQTRQAYEKQARNVKQWTEEWLDAHANEPETLANFVQAFTGSRALTSDINLVIMENTDQIELHTCFFQAEIPLTTTEEGLKLTFDDYAKGNFEFNKM